MKVRIVDRPPPDAYPHGVQLLDLDEELVRAGFPALSAVETGSVIQPELRIRFGTRPVNGEEREIPDGAVEIEYRTLPDSYRQKALDGRLVFGGLKKELADLQVLGTPCWSDGRGSELALRVGLAEAANHPRSTQMDVDDDSFSAEVADESESYTVEGYSPAGTDRRLQVQRQIRERRGQTQFRDALRSVYGDVCLVTGCAVLAVLEAAHISPYRGEGDNHLANGLLLRSDIHTLFDSDLLGIDPKHLRVELDPDVAKEYGHLAGIEIRSAGSVRVSRQALQQRYARFRRRLRRPA
jgi:hypothetical protein